MKIIVTNDDGVQAPGILALATALRTLGDVQVIGPAHNQSASGHKKTLFQDIPANEVELADGEDGVSPGQACVFYDAGSGQARVLGGGFIKGAAAADTVGAAERRLAQAAMR